MRGYLTACRTRRGFTLIEMLIVITIIAILAILVIPRTMAARRHAKEAELVANLKQLRDSIECFEANTGAWPPDLHDIMAKNGDAITNDQDGRGGHVDRKAYDGPYIVSPGGDLPSDPFTETDNWDYSNSTGAVHSRSDMKGLDGSSYSTW